MFEKTLLTMLKNDPIIGGVISTYTSNNISIFSEFAPEGASLPYLVFKISYGGDNDVVVHKFTVMFDYFDYQTSAVEARNVAARLMFLFDHVKIDSDRYGCIRLFFFGGGMIDESDPRAIHYNMEFEARAGRKAWALHNNTTIEP